MRHVDLYERLYDVVKNMEWHLEHTPDHPLAQPLGVVDGSEFWLLESKGFPIGQSSSVPGVTFLYRYDAAAVYIRDVRITPPPSVQNVFRV